jgi:uncharacterized protein (TIGR00369 family)
MHEGVRNPFPSLLGVRVEETRPGYARLRLTVEPGHLDCWGRVHRGLLSAMMDSAVGAALGHLKAERGLGGAPQATIAMDALFLASAAAEEVVAEGRVLALAHPVAFGEALARLPDGTALARASFVFLVGEARRWPTPT